MKATRTTTLLLGLALTGLGSAATLATTGDATTPTPPVAAAPDLAVRGGYLVRAMGCNHCHTPYKIGPNGPEPDMSLELSGHPSALVMPPAPALPPGPWVWSAAGTNTAFAGPWGVSFTANLTPDRETGLGAWTEDMFIATMRTGRHQGKGRQILPPMPYENLAGLEDQDIRAIFAYLQSIKPVKNRVPAPIDPPEGDR